jgi:hypothetical protein
MYVQIPVDILEQHEGKWIVWDQDDQKVVGAADNLDEAEDQAEQFKTDHLLRVHHVLPRDSEIAGML